MISNSITVQGHAPGHEVLLAAFEKCVLSHGEDARAALQLARGARLVVDVVDGDARERHQLVPGAHEGRVAVTLAEATHVLNMSRAFRWANGMVILPIAAALERRQIWAALRRSSERLALHLHCTESPDPPATLGHFLGALRLLALAGWLRIEGSGKESRVHLTPLGSRCVDRLASLPEVAKLAIASIPASLDYRQHLKEPSPAALAAAHALDQLCPLIESRWHLTHPGDDAVGERAAQHLEDYLNGTVVGPLLVALGMPEYQQVGDSVVEVGPALLRQLSEQRALELRPGAGLNVDFARSAFRVLRALDLAQLDADERQVKMSAAALALAEVAAPVLALPGSYYPSYSRIEEILFENPDPLGMREDKHVDRLMNIYGSSGAGSGPATSVISERILRRLFDELPLDEQPAGISDMGCGDGKSLGRLAEYIVRQTRRGRSLATHPLHVLGADFNDRPLQRTRETLRGLGELPGVIVRVVKADVTRPDEYDASVRALGLEVPDPKSGVRRPLGLGDLVHTLMFLVHNRRLQVRTADASREILWHAIERTDRTALAHAIALAQGREITLPSHGAGLLALVMDQFKTTFADQGKMVDGFVVAADLVAFLQRWAPFARQGLIALEGHSPWASKLLEPVPPSSADWLRLEKLPHAFNWGMHFLSGQYLQPYEEFRLGLLLAGFEASGGRVYGGLYPEHVPSLDRLDDYRFLSIGCYVPFDGE
ncbi:MAG: hypothetical protein ABI895_33115 [Deltaproteobacteria bacterium]